MRKTLKFSLLLVIVWICYLTLCVWNYPKTEYPTVSDCAIVLGASIRGNTPSPVFESRIKHAVNLYQNKQIKKIIFTGGYGDGLTLSESRVAANYAVLLGVPRKDILTETVSHTTHQNLEQAKVIMSSNFLETAIIISDPLHLKRASLMAKDLDIAATTSATPISRYRTFKSKLTFLAREVFFINYYFITGS